MSASHNDLAVGEWHAYCATRSLSVGAQLSIWGMRQWLVSVRQRRCIKRDLIPVFCRQGCVDAIGKLDTILRVLAQSAERGIAICCPNDPRLGTDEWLLLQSLQAIQREEYAQAERVLTDIGNVSNGSYRSAAVAYVDQLTDAGLSLTGMSSLAEVVT